jgi:hypothetical protein
VRYVKDAEAEVRCQPSTNPEFYATNRLRRGDAVEVDEVRPDGWLKIRPPRGSFSWINTRFLQHIASNQPNYVITPPDELVPVYVGSEVQKGRPTVIGAKLKRGTQVQSIGKPLAGDTTSPSEAGPWMPIEAPEGEFRYILANAVDKTRPAVDVVAAARVPTAGPGGSTFVPAAGTGPPAAAQLTALSGNAITPVADLQALYARARQAQDANKLSEAITLYEQAATTAQNQGNTAWASQVFAHAQVLRDRLRSATPAPASETRYTSPTQAQPAVHLAAPPGTTPAAATLTASGSPAANLPSSGPGRLRRAGRTVEYQRTYVLENAQGLPLLYVTAGPGIDLEPYVEHNVELFGQTAYRGEIRAYYMTVARVQPLP